jgi:signal transduction histidine kinase
MALLLAATSIFLYVRLGATLDEAVDDELEARTAELIPALERGEPRLSEIDDEERFVQILGAEAPEALDATRRVGLGSVLTPAQYTRARESAIQVELDSVRGYEGSARILATPVRTAVLVVGASLDDRDEALAGLLGELALVEPIALLLAALLGYGIATAALRPVESMRAEAATISAVEPGSRLSPPRAKDELRRLGETLNSMLDRLEAGLERERAFVADASHELRTPLAALKTELELAARRPRSPEELERVLASAAEETDRLAQLADDLLVLARHDEGAVPLRLDPVRVAELLSRVAGRFAGRAARRGREVVVDPISPELEVEGDELRLEQALGNLVGNAVVHGAGTIRLSASLEPAGCVFRVRDEGPGVPVAFLPSAFERFGRADQGRSGRGTGLGLAIVRAIAEAHGGSAELENLPGGGVVARVVLPRRTD